MVLRTLANAMKAFIGIDPGKSGGIAIIGGGKPPTAYAMPETERDLWDILQSLRRYDDCEVSAALEWVRSSPQMGVVSAFTFGQGYGALKMALVAAGIPFREVRPAVWQKELGCLTKGDKAVSLRKAQEMFPDHPWSQVKKYNLPIADALLIAEWLRRQP